MMVIIWCDVVKYVYIMENIGWFVRWDIFNVICSGAMFIARDQHVSIICSRHLLTDIIGPIEQVYMMKNVL